MKPPHPFFVAGDESWNLLVIDSHTGHSQGDDCQLAAVYGMKHRWVTSGPPSHQARWLEGTPLWAFKSPRSSMSRLAKTLQTGTQTASLHGYRGKVLVPSENRKMRSCVFPAWQRRKPRSGQIKIPHPTPYYRNSSDLGLLCSRCCWGGPKKKKINHKPKGTCLLETDKHFLYSPHLLNGKHKL